MNYKYLSFRTDIAEDVGTNAATIFQYLLFWINKNEKDHRNNHDGKYWTYNTQSQILEELQFLTRDKLQYALKKLVDKGYIIKGRYNKNPYDRTTWYALGSKGLEIQAELKDDTREQAKPQQKKQPQSHSKKKNSTEQPKRYDSIHDVMLFGEYSSSLDYWDGLTYGEYLQKHHSYLYPQYLAEEEEKKRIQAIEERKATAQTINA